MQTCRLERRSQEGRGEGTRDAAGAGRTDAAMAGGALQGVSHGKAPFGLSFGGPRPALRSRPALITQLLLNLKRRAEGDVCSFFPLLLFLTFPSCPPLSVRGQVCHAAGALPQTINADKIHFLRLIPVGTEHTVLNWACVHCTFLTEPMRPLPDFSSLDRILNECLFFVARDSFG